VRCYSNFQFKDTKFAKAVYHMELLYCPEVGNINLAKDIFYTELHNHEIPGHRSFSDDVSVILK